MSERNLDPKSLDLLRETIHSGEIVPVIGAGIHSLDDKLLRTNKLWKKSRTIIKDWDTLLNEAAKEFQLTDYSCFENKYSPTLKWELIIYNIISDEPAYKKELMFVDFLQNIVKEAESEVKTDLSVYKQLRDVLQHKSISNIISLNIEFIVEYLITNGRSNLKVSGEKGIDRRSIFNNKTIWHPHGDYQNKKSITFGLRHYSQLLGNVESARKRYKQHEVHETEFSIKTWVDLVMSKPLLFIGTSVDLAEWDIWLAIINRWRNFSAETNKKYEPPVFVLSKNNDHQHFPKNKFHFISGRDYNESWDILSTCLK